MYKYILTIEMEYAKRNMLIILFVRKSLLYCQRAKSME